MFSQDVSILIKTKYPVYILEFGVVISELNVKPEFIFPLGLQLNEEAYIKCREELVLLWIVRVASRRPYIRQQASMPCQTSRRTQCWLWENFYDHITPNIWPPNSPDCNPLDYYVWGAVWWETNKTLCNIKNELKARITAAFNNLKKETEKLAGDFEVVWRLWLKPKMISLNKSNLSNLKIFSCNFVKYIW